MLRMHRVQVMADADAPAPAPACPLPAVWACRCQLTKTCCLFLVQTALGGETPELLAAANAANARMAARLAELELEDEEGGESGGGEAVAARVGGAGGRRRRGPAVGMPRTAVARTQTVPAAGVDAETQTAQCIRLVGSAGGVGGGGGGQWARGSLPWLLACGRQIVAVVGAGPHSMDYSPTRWP